jgi:hypothetical protein
VNDAALVRVMHGAGQRFDQGSGLARQQRPGGQFLGQAVALDVFQGEVRFAVLLADIVNLYDIGVPQTCRRLGFAAEAGQRFGRRLPGRANALEGDQAVESVLSGFPDHAHAAFAQHFQQLVSRHETKRPRRRDRRHAGGCSERMGLLEQCHQRIVRRCFQQFAARFTGGQMTLDLG